MIQLTELKGKFNGHYEKLKQNFQQTFIRKYIQLVPHPASYTEPIRPITSNFGTATYHLPKYLAQLLKPLSESRYTVKNTKKFTNKIRKQKIPKDHTTVSFDVASLFTNVLLEGTINIILRRIYEKKEIVTDIHRCEMRELLYLCTIKMCTLCSTTKFTFRMTV